MRGSSPYAQIHGEPFSDGVPLGLQARHLPPLRHGPPGQHPRTGPRTVIRVVATLAAVAAAAALAAAAIVYGGVYDVSAASPHTQPMQLLLKTVMRNTVRRRAVGFDPPATPANGLRGAGCFRDRCEQCHGGPGVAPHGMGLGMEPSPGPLIDAARHWQQREVYWIVRYGLKMTGMPAWQYQIAEPDIWAVAAFTMSLAEMSPADYAARRQAAAGEDCRPELLERASSGAGNVERGRDALKLYGCRSCHLIPGVPGPDVHVGPPLDGIARRELIAGKLPNTPDQLERWIRFPTQVDPQTAMPDVGVGADEARDIAAFLMTLN